MRRALWFWCFLRAYHHFDYPANACGTCGISRRGGPRLLSHIYTFDRKASHDPAR